jgi:hypothetical protein
MEMNEDREFFCWVLFDIIKYYLYSFVSDYESLDEDTRTDIVEAVNYIESDDNISWDRICELNEIDCSILMDDIRKFKNYIKDNGLKKSDVDSLFSFRTGKPGRKIYEYLFR